MSRRVKGLLSSLLRRGLRASASLRGAWQRAAAHARLAAAIDSPLDPSVVVLGPVEVHGSGRVRCGRDLYLYRELYLETRERGRIALGDGVVLSRGVHIVSFAEVTIGDGAMLGEYTSVRDANHRRDGGPVRDAGHDATPIRIGRNVWIGRGVAVLPGVTIGDDAVVGANAVVTHDLPAGCVAVGVPARPIRTSVAA